MKKQNDTQSLFSDEELKPSESLEKISNDDLVEKAMKKEYQRELKKKQTMILQTKDKK